MLSASDAGRIGRLVLPKKCAKDASGKEWQFQFRFWPNNNSRMYVLEGVTPCIQAMQLQAGDIDPNIPGQMIQIRSEVTAFKVGDKVICRLSYAKSGRLAEYAIASETETALHPEKVSSVDTAALPTDDLTALECLQMIGTKFDGTRKGENILITVASSSVGSYAVQLAKLGSKFCCLCWGATISRYLKKEAVAIGRTAAGMKNYQVDENTDQSHSRTSVDSAGCKWQGMAIPVQILAK
ncbi:B3 domain-containing protein [Carex littledalei]|uniref:B3 domain-containing protein n=1 Tax=Carex littledalei TaxID=544730 RepID=A0A833W0L9_9POAL|nr:B3 domain-containing protein [Carex littledalei]